MTLHRNIDTPLDRRGVSSHVKLATRQVDPERSAELRTWATSNASYSFMRTSSGISRD